MAIDYNLEGGGDIKELEEELRRKPNAVYEWGYLPNAVRMLSLLLYYKYKQFYYYYINKLSL